MHINLKPKIKNIQSMDQHQKDLEMAKRVQEAILSVGFKSSMQGLMAVHRCIPTKTVGGDFFAFVEKKSDHSITLPRTGVIEYQDISSPSLAVVIGDVAGHGISSALVMALSYGLLTTALQKENPATTLEKVNESIRPYLVQSQVSHLTVFLGVINPQTQEFIYSSAGHHPAILLKSEGTLMHLESAGVFLGMYENEKYEQKVSPFRPGDRLFFYTDGIIELKNKLKEEFGLERFENLILSTQKQSIPDVIDKIFYELTLFTNLDAKDDQTLVIIEYPICGPQV